MQTSTGAGGSMEAATASLATLNGGLGRLQELNVMLSETANRLRALRIAIAGHSPEPAGQDDKNPIPQAEFSVEILWRDLGHLAELIDMLDAEIGMIEVRTVG